VACKDSRVTWERLARWVSRVCLASLGQSVLWANKVLSVPRGSLDLSVCVASRESLAQEACVVLLVQLALLDLSVCVARLAQSVFKASRVPTE
jgi:hypothetical protein